MKLVRASQSPCGTVVIRTETNAAFDRRRASVDRLQGSNTMTYKNHSSTNCHLVLAYVQISCLQTVFTIHNSEEPKQLVDEASRFHLVRQRQHSVVICSGTLLFSSASVALPMALYKYVYDYDYEKKKKPTSEYCVYKHLPQPIILCKAWSTTNTKGIDNISGNTSYFTSSVNNVQWHSKTSTHCRSV